MSSDYQKISEHNERQLGLDTASRRTQIDMYSDSTHFVYEILQNADDCGATEISFKLSSDALVVEHNGSPFTPDNVKAITYFGESTSREDLVKTGRFGVGFKSVFAFTATPVIISGDEHFEIHGLYRLREYPYPSDLDRSTTRIVLPFNHHIEMPDYVENYVPANDAYSKISDRLRTLNISTMLFTHNIREVRWEVEGDSGHYLREDVSTANVRWTTITDGVTTRKFLTFSRTPSWRNMELKSVEIAFEVDEEDQPCAIDDCLYVLFPTNEETRFQFILNGPYRTNPARESISEDDPFNMHLAKETSDLMKEVLLWFKRKGILTTQFLSLLPNPNDNIRDFYKPIYEAILSAFQEHELVPTDDGGYAAAAHVFRGPAPLREVVTRVELSFLANKENSWWAKGVQQNSRSDNFLQGLSIEYWGWKDLEESLRSRYDGQFSSAGKEKDVEWLRERGDNWMQKLYILLGDAIRKGECNRWQLEKIGIVRVKQNGEEVHVAATKAYLPKRRSFKELPQVKRSILKGRNEQACKKIEEGLVSLGVKEIGEEERIDLILQTFYGGGETPVSPKQHLNHMKAFLKCWKKEGTTSKFNQFSIFRVAGTKDLKEAGACFLDSPFRSSGLNVIYGKPRKGIELKSKLWTGYRELSSQGFSDFADACGVQCLLPIEQRECNEHPDRENLLQGWANRGIRRTRTTIDTDFVIPDLASLLDQKDREINHLIWRTVGAANPEVLEAKFRPNQNHTTRHAKSSLILTLSTREWVPDMRGTLRTPADVSKDKLHTSFRYDNRNGWLDEIGFGEKAKEASETFRQRKRMANDLGISSEFVERLKELPEEEQKTLLKGFEDQLKERAVTLRRLDRQNQEILPFHDALAASFEAADRKSAVEAPRGNGGARNPRRRRAKLIDEISSAIENEPSLENRFFIGHGKKWKGKNDQVKVKLLEWYGGKCQICDRTFTQRNGKPYFEGVYLVPYTKSEWIDRVGNVVCICPWHSAMWQFGTREVEKDVLDQIGAFVPHSEGGEDSISISMKLCDEHVELRFVENHLLELQVMIEESREESDKTGSED